MIVKLIPAGNVIFSIDNQINFQLVEDAIVEVVQNGTIFCFVRPVEFLSNIHGFGPNVIRKGRDEWSVNPLVLKKLYSPEPVGI